MNYLVAVDTFFPDRPSGSARVAFDIAQVMRDRGHRVTIFCSKQSPDAEDISAYEGIRVVRFAFPKTMPLDLLKVHKQKTAGVNAARTYLVDTHWDLIHFHVPLYGKIFYEIFGDAPRYIYTVHSPIVMEQQINWSNQGVAGRIKLLLGKRTLKNLEGGLLLKVQKIHTLSQYTKSKLEEFYGVGHKVNVIPHWCREDFVRQHSKERARTLLAWPQDAKILFTLRYFGPRYGLDIAIKAAAPLLKKYTCLRFAMGGYGILKPAMMRLAKDLGVDDKIWFMGRVSDDILRQCYEAADMFILPTRALECFGLPILESFAYGLPVISTDAAAIPELMKPILPECIVPSGSVEALREKLALYLQGKLSFPTSEQLTKYVQTNFGRGAVVPRLYRLLEDLPEILKR